VASITIGAPAATVERLRTAEGDLKAVGRIDTITYTDADSTTVASIELGEV